MIPRLAALLIFLSAAACAEPRYTDSVPSAADGQSGAAAADCSIQFRTSQACLTWTWEQRPTEDEPGSLVFKVYRLNVFDQTPVAFDLEGKVGLVLWMPSMGHGSTPARVQRLDTGTYRAANVHFVMPGDWEFRFQVKDGNTLTDEAVVSLSI